MSQLSRRQFLYGSAAALGSLSVGRSVLWAAAEDARTGRLPRPEQSGIDHIVVAMMENRSFDHLLGWLPGAGGRQAGLVYKDNLGQAFKTYRLAPDFQGCSHHDPSHSFDDARVQYNDGRCDGWLRAGASDIFSIGYYTRPDLPFLGKAAPDWTVCNRYFAAIMAPTYPNRLYQHAAVTDRLDDSLSPTSLTTIWDRLSDAGLDGRYYHSDTSFLDLWGLKYSSISQSYPQFLQDCAAGNLPEVAFVDPPLSGEAGGTSADDHPHGDIRAGEWWLYQTYRAVTTSPEWKRTVLVITFDEWGGFFDHVVPSAAPDVDPSFELRGFRVPTLIVSPFSRPGSIASDVYDHTSILKMIEWRWDLPALSMRDDAANNLATALDFSFRRRHVRGYAVPQFTSVECPGA
ncbi:MAG TPA: alkaline phosphatase family protein [Thermoanaerobaculia bacterium]|nr:alkaline phosphatase family protein [Thermoanaerobaculia bacterium]